MNMRVSEIVSSRMGNTIENVNTWNGILTNVKAYGAKGDGVTDDTVAIQAAINAAITAGNGTVVLPPGDYVISSTLSIDVSKVSICGLGSRLNCNAVPAGQSAIHIYSSVTTEFNKFTKNIVHGLEDIAIYRTSHLSGSIGLQYGHNTYTSNNDFKIKGLSVWNFDTNLNFLNNSWRCHFDQCSFVSDSTSNTKQIQFNNPTNSGEAMYFSHCVFLGNATPSLLNGGFWNFVSCSFLHSTVTTGSSGLAIFNACNLESLGNANYRMINHTADAFHVRLDGCSIIPDSNLSANAWTQSPINNTSVESGMHLESCFIQQGSAFAFYEESGNNVNQIIAGSGRVTSRTNGTFDNLPGIRNVLISKGMNLLYNGDAETGNTNGWTFTAYGTAGATFTADAAAKKNGTYGFNALGAASGGGNAVQYVKVEPGQLVLLQGWGKRVSAASIAGFMQIEFYDDSKTYNIGSIASQEVGFSGSGVWDYQYVSGRVPAGAGWAKIILNVQSQSPAAQVYLDDITVNIM